MPDMLGPPVLDYRDSHMREKRPSLLPAVASFILATACTSYLVFARTGWIRFARPGSQLFGPQDQYVGLGHSIGAGLYGGGMCIVGGCLFTFALMWSRRRGPTNPEGHGWIWGMALGVGYTLVFALTVWLAEQIAGPTTGGPQVGEQIVFVAVGLVYPALAGAATAWFVERFG